MTGRNPYLIPDSGDHRVINFSGGRSSAYMLFQILRANGAALPANATVVFCNTGKEREETLDFVQRCSDEWGVVVHWLEYCYRRTASGKPGDFKNAHRVVDHATASRRGEPFEAMAESKQMLPNPVMRMCTQELKIKTVQRYMHRDLGIPRFRNIIGIRHDEPRRWLRAVEDCMVDHPLHLAGVTARDVKLFWAAQTFDLGLASWQSNCDLCFLKGKANLMQVIRDAPDRAEWWIGMERKYLRKRQHMLEKVATSQFNKNHRYEDLLSVVQTQPELDFVVDESSVVDCFCGD